MIFHKELFGRMTGTLAALLLLAGTQDQIVSIGSNNTIDLDFDKPVGDMTLTSGTFRASGATGGKIDNRGTVTVADGQTLETAEYIDRPTAILDGQGTIKTRRITRGGV
jgi:hypothetical protein